MTPCIFVASGAGAYHPSHDDPQHCPVCGATVHPLHWTPQADGPWVWTARCWTGHEVAPLPEQMTLLEGATHGT